MILAYLYYIKKNFSPAQLRDYLIGTLDITTYSFLPPTKSYSLTWSNKGKNQMSGQFCYTKCYEEAGFSVRESTAGLISYFMGMNDFLVDDLLSYSQAEYYEKLNNCINVAQIIGI